MGSPVTAGSKPAALFLLLVAVALTAGTGRASAATFLVTNMCPFAVWPAAIPIGGSTLLNSGQAWLFTVPPGTKGGRIWGRTGCTFTGNHGQCATDNCAAALLRGLGESPATMAKFTLGGGGGAEDNLYDILVAEGFNLPMSFMCDDRSGEEPVKVA